MATVVMSGTLYQKDYLASVYNDDSATEITAEMVKLMEDKEVSSGAADDDAQEEFYFHPGKGNVAFASAFRGWGFT